LIERAAQVSGLSGEERMSGKRKAAIGTGWLLFAGLGAPLAPLQAQTTAYPVKPIRMLVGFPAGGGADIVARILGPRLSDALGQQIIVDNRPGAGSAIASEMAAKAPADGYTLVSIGSSHAVNAAFYPRLPYRPAADFSAIVLVSTAPVTITAHPAVPVKSLKELIVLARAPGAVELRLGRGERHQSSRRRVVETDR
jgi:tripartite-type tricarboxylate transporter receptor subunit TctC